MKYRLFGMKPTTENICWAAQYGYYRATPGYLLTYTKGRKPPRSIPVAVEQLSAEDRLWLQRCNNEIIRETVEQSPGIQEKMMRLLGSLGVELEKEQEKLREGEREH